MKTDGMDPLWKCFFAAMFIWAWAMLCWYWRNISSDDNYHVDDDPEMWTGPW